MNKEIEYLKKYAPEKALNIEVINALKKLRELAEVSFDAPEPFKSVLEKWHQFKLFGFTMIAQDEYPSLRRCWDDIGRVFHDFDDETFLEAYCLLDFPFSEGKSFAEIFHEKCKDGDGVEHLSDFSLELSKTRLGLYQVILATRKVIKLKESVTGSIYEVFNTIDASKGGEMFLVRLFPVAGNHMMFADPKVFPKEKKNALEDMVMDKAYTYYSSYFGSTIHDDRELYALHMKLSGPYWMSLVTDDHSVDILNPNYWERYLS